jgi:hypothetical protein
VCPYILGNEFCERLAFYGCARTRATPAPAGTPAPCLDLRARPRFAAQRAARTAARCLTSPARLPLPP